MSEQELLELIQAKFVGDSVATAGDGRHFDLRIISDQFNDLPKVKRQQMVYALVQDHIREGRLHALNIHAITPAEWEAKNG